MRLLLVRSRLVRAVMEEISGGMLSRQLLAKLRTVTFVKNPRLPGRL